MIREQARIVAIRAGHMHLSPLGGGCGSCSSSAGCGVARLGRLLPSAQRELVLPVDGERRVGDLLELELPESALLAAAAMAYLPPLIGLIGGALAITPSGAALQPLGALLGVIAGLSVSRILTRLHRHHLIPRPLNAAAAGIFIPIHKELPK